MTEQEKTEILDELEKRLEKKYKGCIYKEDTQAVLKNVRKKWFTHETHMHKDSPMHKVFGNIIYWQVWELIRKMTCIICGCQYVRHLSGCDYAEEVAEKLCQIVYDLKVEYEGRAWRNDNERKAD